MKQPHFRLNTVLEHRERLEDEAQMHMARIERRLVGEQEVLRAIEAEFEDVTHTLRNCHQDMSHDDLRMSYSRADFLARSIRTHEVTIMNVKMELEAARQELLKAAKDRRVLETLKERRHTAYMAEVVRIEHAHLDDANNRRPPSALEHMKDFQ